MQITCPKPKLQPLPPPPKHSQWDALVTSLIRPPRFPYPQSKLTSLTSLAPSSPFTRSDHSIPHNPHHNLLLTLLSPACPCPNLILYLHGSSSSKLQSLQLLPFLPQGYSLGCFDFIGCGNNYQKDYVTLGLRQSQQVQTVVKYLRNRAYRVVLWGRSMGAVSALLYGKVDVIVADSPFSNMKQLCKQNAINKLPQYLSFILSSCCCLFQCFYLKLRHDIKQKANYDLSQLDIVKAVRQIDPGAVLVLVVGEKDQLVGNGHSQRLYQEFRGEARYLEIVQAGGHNGARPREVVEKVMGVVVARLGLGRAEGGIGGEEGVEGVGIRQGQIAMHVQKQVNQ